MSHEWKRTLTEALALAELAAQEGNPFAMRSAANRWALERFGRLVAVVSTLRRAGMDDRSPGAAIYRTEGAAQHDYLRRKMAACEAMQAKLDEAEAAGKTELGESKEPDYNGGIMGDTTTQLDVVAKSGLSTSELQEAIDNYKAAKAEHTARETRAKAKPRAEARKGDDLKLSSKQVAAVIADSTLGRLQARYGELLKIKFPAKRLKDVKQARLAAKLSTTYGRLRDIQIELGLDPLPKDRRVAQAERLKADFYRKSQKNKPTRAPAPSSGGGRMKVPAVA